MHVAHGTEIVEAVDKLLAARGYRARCSIEYLRDMDMTRLRIGSVDIYALVRAPVSDYVEEVARLLDRAESKKKALA